MTSQVKSDSRLVHRLKVFSAAASLFSIAIGLSALVGWVFGVAILKSWLPGQPTVRFNVAVCFVLLGLALFVLRKDGSQPGMVARNLMARIAAASVSLLGLLTLLENLFGWDLHVDQLLYVVRPGEEVGAGRPGLVPLIAAMSLMLLGAALLMLNWRIRSHDWPSHLLAVMSAIVSWFGVLDFVLGQGPSETQIALPAALNCTVLSLGVMCARAESVLDGFLVSQSAGARWLRRAGPASLAILTLFFELMAKALLTSVHFSWIEVSAIGTTAALLLAALIGRSAVLLDRSERKRKTAEEALQLDREQLGQLIGCYEDPQLERSLRRWSLAGITIGMLLSGLGGLSTWWSVQKADEDARWLLHTSKVDVALGTALNDIVDIETGARGYAAAGGKPFLEPYLSGRSAIHADLDSLASLTADSAVQQQYMRQLRLQIDARIEIAENVVAEYNQEKVTPSAAIFQEGQRRMNAVRATIQQMRAEEARLFAQRATAVEMARSQTKLATLISSLLGVILLLFAGLIASREISRSAKMHRQIQILNTDLERRVREQTEDLRLSEQRIRMVMNSTAEAIFGEDMHGNCTFCNRATAKLLGYKEPYELLGKNMHAVIHHSKEDGTSIPIEECPIQKAVLAGRDFHTDGVTYWRKDGTNFIAECWSHPIIDEGRIVGSVVTFLDVTTRKQAEHLLRLFIEHAPVALAMFDHEMRYLHLSHRWRADYGLGDGDLCGMSHYELFPEIPERWKEAHRRGLKGEVLREENDRFDRADGSVRWIRWEIRPWYESGGAIGGIVISTEDMTQQRALENQLRESQKMEAVGQLAGGIAHDFNNLLQIIIGECGLMSDELGRQNPLHENVGEIQKASQHAARLVSQLLAFSRKQMLQPRVLDLNSIVSDGSDMLRRIIREDIRLNTVLAPDLGPVKADPTQILQILINLTTNSRDAMPCGGTLKIETRNVTLPPDAPPHTMQPSERRYALLEVTDTGTGMDEKTKARVFEPFFTTKKALGVGMGTGLGLATVYGIVKQSNGFIYVDSHVGKGSTFRVYLPLIEQKPELQHARQDPIQNRTMKATILLVEDSEPVRRLMQAGLETANLTILCAADGVEALQLAEHHPGPIHLLITDVMLPGMRGPEIAAQLSSSRPEMKILYISGYSDEILAGIQVKGRFIQKPVQVGELKRNVIEMLALSPQLKTESLPNAAPSLEASRFLAGV